jgi:hypothetical protein
MKHVTKQMGEVIHAFEFIITRIKTIAIFFFQFYDQYFCSNKYIFKVVILFYCSVPPSSDHYLTVYCKNIGYNSVLRTR